MRKFLGDSANPASDPLLIVGGGSGLNALSSNALVLRANGDAAFAGKLTTSAAALGTGLAIGGAAQTVLGRYNASVAWDAANPARDPLLIVGGGTTAAPSNALVLRANGDAVFGGKLIAGPATFAQGDYATAIGFDSSAFGPGAVTLGMHSHASGVHSVAIGRTAMVAGDHAVALGSWNTSSAFGTTTLGSGCYAPGVWGFAAGANSKASGEAVIAIGRLCEATEYGAVVLGANAFASANYAVALAGARATARYATAIGEGALAEASNQTVIGKFNAPAPTALLAVGNGTAADAPSRKNAFEVRADGVVHARVVRVAESGDLSMGDFKNSPAPFDP